MSSTARGFSVVFAEESDMIYPIIFLDDEDIRNVAQLDVRDTTRDAQLVCIIILLIYKPCVA